jgi:hypothetical protein
VRGRPFRDHSGDHAARSSVPSISEGRDNNPSDGNLRAIDNAGIRLRCVLNRAATADMASLQHTAIAVSSPRQHTDDMRRAFTLIFYLSMIGVGAWCAYEWLVLGGRGVVFKAGGFLALFGLYLLWIDFLPPNRGRL